MYADIIIDITHEKLDKVFQYMHPSRLEGMLEVGTEVVVPFEEATKKHTAMLSRFRKRQIMIRQRSRRLQEKRKKVWQLRGNWLHWRHG